jgi:hypothetical protein
LPQSYTAKIISRDADDFRDQIAHSGVFDMYDCEVEIYCPELAMADEVQRMVNTIESMINVVDVRIVSTPETLQIENYQVIITEVQNKYTKRFGRNEKEK